MTSFKRLAAIATLRCFMATVAFASPAQASGDFASNAATRTLTEDMVQPIHAGMTATEVLAIIGPPLRKIRFDRSATTAWDYRFKDSWGYRAEFSVIVDDNGIVVSKVAVRQDP